MTRRTQSQYDWEKVLFDETIIPNNGKNYNTGRSANIEFITVHHMMIQDRDLSRPDALDACWRTWVTEGREASAHYGVEDHFVRQFVNDVDTAWANGNAWANARTIAIEHANSGLAPNYPVSTNTWKTGARLVAYLCKAYKLGRPAWGKNVRKHNDFSATGCPGPFMTSILATQYIQEAQRVYDAITSSHPSVPGVPANAGKFHTVSKGESLSSIAARYNTTWQRLAKVNNIANPNRIFPGQKIKVG